MLKNKEQGCSILMTVISDFFQIHRLPARYLQHFICWIIYEWLQKKTLPFYIGMSRNVFCAYNFQKIIIEIWKKQIVQVERFVLETWMETVNPNLQIILHYKNDDLNKSYQFVTENNMYVENDDGVITSRSDTLLETEQAKRHTTVSFLTGKDLIFNKSVVLNDLLETREVFLERENDYLYFSVPKHTAEIKNHDFYDSWVVALHANTTIYVKSAT